MNTNELLARAISFDGGCHPFNGHLLTDEYGNYISKLHDSFSNHITIEYRGESRWAICWGRSCLSKLTDEFEYEMLPSARDEAFFQEFRFVSVQEAFEHLAAWRKRMHPEFIKRSQSNGKD